MKITHKEKCPACSRQVAIPDEGGPCPVCKNKLIWKISEDQTERRLIKVIKMKTKKS